MPRQPLNRHPFTKTLSTLCKNELIRLAIEFDLPSDGSVISLRNRLKTHLTLHNEAIYRNPRYTGLYPRPRHLNIIRQPSPPNSTSLQYQPSTPRLSYRSLLPAPPFTSWHGIGIQPDIPQSPILPVHPLPQHQPSPFPFSPPPNPMSIQASPPPFGTPLLARGRKSFTTSSHTLDMKIPSWLS